MLRKLNSLIPSFLKSIDKYLLLNQPGLWATRIHYVAFFILVFGGLLMLNAFLRPVVLSSVPDPETNFMLLIFPCFLALGIWTYRVSLFQVEKGFGEKSLKNRLRDQLVYAGAIMALAAIPYLYGQVVSEKISSSITEKELIANVKEMNKGFSSWEGLKYHLWVSVGDTFSTQPEIVIKEKNEEVMSEEEKANSALELEHYFRKYSSFNATLEELYQEDLYLTNEYYYEIESNILSIIQAKDQEQFFQRKGFLNFYLCILVFPWLILLSFINSTWKELLLSIVFGLSLSLGVVVLITMMEFMFQFGNNGFYNTLFHTLLISCFALFIYQAYRKTHTRHLNTWKGANLILATCMTPFLPYLLDVLFPFFDFLDDSLFNLVFGGMILGILAWNLFYQKRFAQLQMLPKDN